MSCRPSGRWALSKGAGVVVLASGALVPATHVVATPEVVSQPPVALQGANRVGNTTQTDAPIAPTPTVPPAPSIPGVSSEMQQVLDLVNVERTSRGLVPVTFSVQLNTAALAHTQRQATDGALFHTDPRDGSSPADRISRTGYSFSTWGENIASKSRTPTSVMQVWMNSSVHCKNILNPAFTELGVGYVTGGLLDDQFWTQVFARPQDTAQPAGTYNAAWC